MKGGRIRICIATSYGATEEPRGPRYAAEIARMDPRFDVTFIDCVPHGSTPMQSVEFRELPNVTSKSWMFPWRGGRGVLLAAEKIRQRLAERSFRTKGELRTAILSTRSIGLEKMMAAERADLYFSFNIDTLLPVYHTARASRAPFLFDCHEIHAEMAYDQTAIERAAIRAIQRQCLPAAALVLAASPQAAGYLESKYGIHGVLPLLNAAPLEVLEPQPPVADFALYWRNSTIDLGLRGLNDILTVMPLLAPPIRLYLQGRPSLSHPGRVEQTIRKLGIEDRVTILPPYRLHQAVKTAVPYAIGLSLESPASINMDLTSTNKFFEYAMAGLAIVSTRTAGHRDLVTSKELGLLYESGDAEDLARQIRRLYEDRALLAAMRANARRYAEGEGNLQFQMRRFRDAFRERVLPLLERG